MIKILFVCHGNICRSPMAEYVMKKMVKDRGLSDRFLIASAATSTEEIGNSIYPPAKAELRRRGVPFDERSARQVTRKEYGDWDYFVCMDEYNYKNLIRIFSGDAENKILMLLPGRSISDPWYTGDFGRAFSDIEEGCGILLNQMIECE